MKTLLSLFDYSGNWSKPYKENGWNVIQHDIKHGQDIFEDTIPAAIADCLEGNSVDGILAAVPCTDFASSGARWWKEKEKYPANNIGNIEFSNTIEMSVFFVLSVLFIVELFNPVFWVIENPVGRIARLVPEVGKPWYFQPYWYGDAYSKKTGLFGVFNKPAKTNIVEPLKVCKQGSWIQKLGGKSERTKELRSVTPMGFAYAFYDANH
jgi:hypothetical protein